MHSASEPHCSHLRKPHTDLLQMHLRYCPSEDFPRSSVQDPSGHMEKIIHSHGTEHKVIDQKAHQRRSQKSKSSTRISFRCLFASCCFFLLNAAPIPGLYSQPAVHFYLYISRHSRSPRSSDFRSISADAIFVCQRDLVDVNTGELPY